jgi:hypothetical protein
MLNSEQQRAVEAVRGPVCILAGAGSGKTTTITHRVANQVESRAFRADEILAVSFTDKASGEMRARLDGLGVPGVRCSTFHSAARGQLRFFAAEPPQRILASKALPLRHIGNTLRRPYRFRPAADLATEIEWAKNRRITPDDYLRSLGDHEPPIPSDLMLRVYREYERRKAEQGWADFEDLIELTIRLFDADEGALEQVRDRYRAFTVDEYQDVNLLSRRSSTAGSATGTSCARSETTTSRSTRSRARAPTTCCRCRGVPECDRRPARGELPIDPRGARVREPARAAARRCGEGPARHATRRPRAGRPFFERPSSRPASSWS